MRVIHWQVQLEAWLASFTNLASFMQLHWSWPAIESVHFIGLTLLLGAIAAWDLRLLGLMRAVPVVAFHRLVPFAVGGFAMNATTGFLFLVTFPDQYVYNAAFHLKMLCLLLAGANVLLFYVVVFRRLQTLPAGEPLPVLARLSGGMSLVLWITIIVCGRMITFFRPALCSHGRTLGFLVDCIVR
jgi:hypothetical protein